MKLNKEIKNRIDQYFENITPEELYFKAIGYGFKEEVDIEIDNQSFKNVGQNFYCSNSDTSLDANDMESLLLAT
ncbi:hypothetical protein [Flavobacterium sp. CS20]|uniref:hypothetical protein n=1 Tax=Flavobacterium sp. CS20 TaxID=2775246 RepID=UPI001B3A6463|nr:hypothetical protein [Flavobacterium sp. CS20]QTY27989.1 hypothetical protein IGB25_05705 [Flavobacterium sp. CS20]